MFIEAFVYLEIGIYPLINKNIKLKENTLYGCSTYTKLLLLDCCCTEQMINVCPNRQYLRIATHFPLPQFLTDVQHWVLPLHQQEPHAHSSLSKPSVCRTQWNFLQSHLPLTNVKAQMILLYGAPWTTFSSIVLVPWQNQVCVGVCKEGLETDYVLTIHQFSFFYLRNK